MQKCRLHKNYFPQTVLLPVERSMYHTQCSSTLLSLRV